MDIKDTIQTRAFEIRDNWEDEQKLKILLDEWEKDFGHEYDETVEEVLGLYIESTWREKAKKLDSNTLEDLLGILLDWPEARYTKEGVEGGYKVTTTLCPIAATYTRIGRQDYGAVFHCSSDPYICKGFNPKIRHRKISSRMEGDEACIHFYTLQE